MGGPDGVLNVGARMAPDEYYSIKEVMSDYPCWRRAALIRQGLKL